ncbi:hypothetical protein GCM10027275_41030 [Rhabdobacter roseus]|uniref:Uncharacterized protein n=1 Tax=Rhabdobacter roseus TaxID=1655419 RepID=A0A840U126_9BACT|nr:hypothetical protein [Rhabdobacter roseus]MBB5286078.1 hypothetical protein [Rhabdobacter roseus]
MKMRLVAVLVGMLTVLKAEVPRADFAETETNERFSIRRSAEGYFVVTALESKQSATFSGTYRVLYRPDDPGMALRPAGIPNVQYNVLSWQASTSGELLQAVERNDQQQGDGFDDRILSARQEARTVQLTQAAQGTLLQPRRIEKKAGGWVLHFPAQPNYTLTAELSLAPGKAYPLLRYELTPKKQGYFSVVYEGAPAFAPDALTDIWQPLIWQEKRFPDRPYLTAAFQCPLPTTLVSSQGTAVGVVAHPDEFPFQPLPLLDNSRFGVMLRNAQGQAQPQLVAPVLGGKESARQPGDRFAFRHYLYVGAGSCPDAFEQIARELYDFKEYRSNAGVGTLNRTIENMISYGMSDYSWFVDSLKGCAYSTDVAGAVKNVSALNPLELALLTDRRDIYEQRAYPIMEFLLSREKFLFSLDPKQKIQHPSRAMRGPAAPISELTALYNISQRQSPGFRQLAEREFGRSRARNLEKLEVGNRWQNALALYRATGQTTYLARAVTEAEKYLAGRVNQPMTGFDEAGAEYFFWTGFTPDWISLFQLYELTGRADFLDAARRGARQYAQFAWFAPRIPAQDIVVNKGGKAPVYWYLASKGHQPMPAAEEKVPAWRVSEIGLTPESSGTASGHRGIFMTNYAPWMLRIGYLTQDTFLQDVARAAVVGRYANFPGYHINTARTTVYEKPDYPLRPFKELSVNSFHFNHIWPQLSLLVDYLVTDAYVRSAGNVDFPSEFIEGYAYLQSKFYGHLPGTFYGEKNVWLWLPDGLLTTFSEELNYLSAYGNNSLYLAFSNQASEAVTSEITLNTTKVPLHPAKTYVLELWENNQKRESQRLRGHQFSVQVPAKGLTACVIREVPVAPTFQRDFVQAQGRTWQTGYLEDETTGTHSMVLSFGKAPATVYTYCVADEQTVRKVLLTYLAPDGKSVTLTDTSYPYEFTIPQVAPTQPFSFSITVEAPDGQLRTSKPLLLKP